jgi:hypothetical protein
MPQHHTVSFTAPCWIYSGQGAWHFVSLPKELADELTHFTRATQGGKRPAGWGTVRVMAQIGQTQWETSMFPDSKTQSYVLPIKAAVRYAENVLPERDVQISISVPMP